MIRQYIAERRSWIILVICLQLLSLLIAYFDPKITVRPILYIIFLSMIIFILFIIIRYQKETKYYKQLQTWNSDYDLSELSRPNRPFEEIVLKRLQAQTLKYKNDISKISTNMEKEKDELLLWIHEVKTPLTAMQLMIERVENPKTRQQLLYEWLRIHLLLDQQLHLKRIPFIENDLYIETISLKSLIYSEIKELQAWCIQKGIGFDVSLDTEKILTDAKWLAFIIRQLLINAVKYSERTDIFIKSYLHQDQTKLVIQDFGRGIDAKDLPRIFEQGFTSTTTHYDNTSSGMGLYLAKKSAHSLHIHIDVLSYVGEGTTFTLTFPQKNEFVAIMGM